MKRVFNKETGLWSITEIEPCELAEIQASVLATYLGWKLDDVEISDETMRVVCDVVPEDEE